ncbi:hypothetical protein DT87_05095 [Streptomyces sp. NTK 937]|nr:hypothetical protein DT87_05095 [Streptomyces sp. NTK 937]
MPVPLVRRRPRPRLPDRAAPDAPEAPPLARGAGWVGCGTSMTIATPDGSRAPVIRLSSSSLDLTRVVRGAMPASAISRVISRFSSGSTRVTTLPDSPARAVRPPRWR